MKERKRSDAEADPHQTPQDPAMVGRHEQRFRALFTEGPAGQAFADLDGRLAAANTEFCRILGRPRAEVVGRLFSELTHADDRDRNAELVNELIAGRLVSFQMAKRYLQPDGSPTPVLNTVTVVETAGERFMTAVAVELPKDTGSSDPLTFEADDRAQTAHRTRHDETDKWHSAWPADLDDDHVKWLWDAVMTTGHELVSALDPQGIIRYSSGAAPTLLGATPDELIGRNAFEIMHPDDEKAVRDTFTRCVNDKTGWQRVRMRVQRPDGSAVWVESSAVAHVSNDGNLIGFTATTRQLDPDGTTRARHSATRSRIEETMLRRHVRTVWQPIYSLETGQAIGVEALTRFSHPDVIQPPDRWFADAQDVELGQQLELLAIDTALASMAILPASLYFSLNVSPTTLASGAVTAAIERAAVSPARIVLELTEHVSIEDYGALSTVLEDMRHLGIRLAVDDAGAGFASFRHILRLKPDIIKLDQSITRGIDENAAQRALGAALVMFAMDVGPLEVIAEGVETEAELSTISTLGIDAVQGYYLARPAPADEIDFDRTISHAWRR